MSGDSGWVPIGSDEVAVLRAVVAGSRVRRWQPLVDNLTNARVQRDPGEWILDIETTCDTIDAPDGVLPVRTFVTGPDGMFHGEILVWIGAGRVTGLEYAWVTESAPTNWPAPEQLVVTPPPGL